MDRRLLIPPSDVVVDTLLPSANGTSVNGLPPGWKREENVRPSGLSAGRVDVYYIGPDGKRFWTKPQLSRYFGETLDLSTFDFQSGRFMAPLAGSVKRSRLMHSAVECNNQRKPDASLQPPIRQTASIFKQPVTVVKTQKSRVKMDFKHGVQESPRQLFWEKRLQGLRATDASGTVLASSDHPPGISPVGPQIDSHTVLHSIATALHLATHPITGQSGDKTAIEVNPAVYINPDQPLIHEMAVSEDDIRGQEERVNIARKKLEEALLMFYPGSISRTERNANAENSPFSIVGKDLSVHGSATSFSQVNPQKKLKLSQNSGQGLPPTYTQLHHHRQVIRGVSLTN